MYVEEICLSTTADHPEAQQPAVPQEATAVLEQTHWMRRCQAEFTLFNNHRLSVQTQGLMQNPRNYTLDLGILDPHPKRMLKIGWGYLLVFVALCGATWFVPIISATLKSVLLSILLGSGAVLSLVMALYRSHDRLVFFSRYGRAPLVVLFNRLPDRAAFNSFTDALVEQIKDAKAGCPDVNETLREELKAHRHLMEQGVISGKRYDIVKQRILGRHSSRTR